jgi:Family of unknown function (DUF5681)
MSDNQEETAKKASNDNADEASGDQQLPTADYVVGYGKPPKESQFKKGVSGNPAGRPKGSKNKNFYSLVDTVCAQEVSLTKNGKSSKVSLIEASLHQLGVAALKGDRHAMKLLLALYEKLCSAMNDNQPSATGSSFDLSEEQLAAIEKSTLLKGVK